MMKKSIGKAVLFILVAAVIVSGCANPQTASQVDPAQSPVDMGNSTLQAKDAAAPAKDLQEHHSVAALEKVYFSYDQSNLSEQARDILSRNAMIMQSRPELRISIEGHCDDRGSDEYNLALGDRRARTVHNYLVSLGVASGRMETVSYGEEKPIDTDRNEMAWAKNRRAEFRTLD